MKNPNSITTCGYVVRKLSQKHGVNPAWLWDLLDAEYNMRGTRCAITHAEADELEEIVIKQIAADNAN